MDVEEVTSIYYIFSRYIKINKYKRRYLCDYSAGFVFQIAEIFVSELHIFRISKSIVNYQYNTRVSVNPFTINGGQPQPSIIHVMCLATDRLAVSRAAALRMTGATEYYNDRSVWLAVTSQCE